MTKPKFYVTTAILYANAEPHVGHTFELIGTDVIARAKRMLGYDVFFQTGTDEHGQKMLDYANRAGMEPKAYADTVAPRHKELWDSLDISYDRFIRTTDPDHYEGVAQFWRRVRDNGDIYKGSYEGWYSVTDEAFVLESQTTLQPDGRRTSTESGAEVTWKKEDSYFFALSKYQDRLVQFLTENPNFIQPAFRANEMRGSFLKQGLQDISISRTSIKWGIPVPDDPEHVIYVWFDALLNYVTGVGYGSRPEEYAKWWPADVHVVGKDILKFHTLLWPAMCMAAGIAPPRRVFGHGFVSLRDPAVSAPPVEGQPVEKMSKSRGNVVEPRAVIAPYGNNPDILRYFLLREIEFGGDGFYSDEAMLGRYNADLADKLGNLLARTLTMVEKYQNGMVYQPASYTEEDDTVRDTITSLFQLMRLPDGTQPAAELPPNYTLYEQLVDEGRFNFLLDRVWNSIQRLNQYITEQRPFSLAKDPAQSARLGAVLYVLCEGLRIITIQIAPFMPRTAAAIWRQLGFERPMDDYNFDRLRQWGLLNEQRVARGENLFPKLEEKKN